VDQQPMLHSGAAFPVRAQYNVAVVKRAFAV
jgi:hypothetical protein